MDTGFLHDYATDAIRYWERRRPVYNLLLASVVVLYFVLGGETARRAVSLNSLLFLFAMAVLANVAYCAAYLVDVFAQMSLYRETWRQRRWMLFMVGGAFAAVLTRSWALTTFWGLK